ncbi:MAG: peptide chain release factor N(5)-glutamine methyltransferase [Gammaproteobacteria bacterium]|nr:peptide chain release factor N(5)-glutamine methyltransferase [Gammaproteobacteria bacterium]
MQIVHYRNLITQQLLSNSAETRAVACVRFDAELLLMHALKKTRTQLLISLNDELPPANEATVNNLITRRMSGEPIAYILGHQPFWTMDLIVTPDTLIPRPETECLIDYILKYGDAGGSLRVADLGTGTGAIAIALALENPNWKIDVTDFSEKALSIAKQNSKKYAVKNIDFHLGDWCSALPNKKYDIIISNPPYIAENDAHLSALKFEPQSALTSGKTGLDAIIKITSQAKNYLNHSGLLIIEHGFDQGLAVAEIFKKNNYINIENHRDLSGNSRFATGIA